jgi:hypothetical protein
MLTFEKHLSTNGSEVWISLDGSVVGRVINKERPALMIRDIVMLEAWHVQAISKVMGWFKEGKLRMDISFKSEENFCKA